MTDAVVKWRSISFRFKKILAGRHQYIRKLSRELDGERRDSGYIFTDASDPDNAVTFHLSPQRVEEMARELDLLEPGDTLR